MKIKSIRKIKLEKPKSFLDITVDKHHNFFIGESAILTHNSSLSSAIIGMAQSFKNSMPILDEIGQFGSLRAPEAGAPRYISTKLHPNFHKLYKDDNLLESQEEDGLKIEPKFFLPIIPAVLLNGSSGIAVGFATNILNRNPKDLIRYCLSLLEGKKPRTLLPWWKDFNGTVEEIDTNYYKIRGIYEVVNTTTVEITELPPSMTFEKFESLLDKLQDRGVIKHYDDKSSDKPHYIIKFQRAELAKLTKGNNDRLESTLKLVDSESENLTCLDEFGKLIVFKTVKELIDYFMNVRSVYYHERKMRMITDLTARNTYLSARARFIKMIIEEKLAIRNVPRSKVEKSLESNKFDRIDGSYSYLLGMPVYSLTKEHFDAMKKEISDNKIELERIKKIQPVDMHIQDLKELQKSL